jgi:hypothetical protein
MQYADDEMKMHEIQSSADDLEIKGADCFRERSQVQGS